MAQQPITDKQLQEWRKLANEATPGEWRVDVFEQDNDYWVRPMPESHIFGVCRTGAVEAPLAKEDAEFIAAARTAVPALLDEVERLRTVNSDEYARGRQEAADDVRQLFGRIVGDLFGYTPKQARKYSIETMLDDIRKVLLTTKLKPKRDELADFTFTTPPKSTPDNFFRDGGREAMERELP